MEIKKKDSTINRQRIRLSYPKKRSLSDQMIEVCLMMGKKKRKKVKKVKILVER